MATLTYTAELVVIDCGNCGLTFAVPQWWQTQHRADGSTFYCPNGHPRVYRETTVAKLEHSLKRKQEEVDWYVTRMRATADQLKASERSNAALKGHLTRYRKRVALGVCPVAGCQRHFPNVQDHVATVHPEWLAEHSDVFEATR